jgi:hypothetical protein
MLSLTKTYIWAGPYDNQKYLYVFQPYRSNDTNSLIYLYMMRYTFGLVNKDNDDIWVYLTNKQLDNYCLFDECLLDEVTFKKLESDDIEGDVLYSKLR